jgi:cytochrome c
MIPKICFLILSVALTAATVPALAQDAATGGADFRQRCQTCHSGQAISIGPNLAGVVGRKAASTNFNYSPALKASGLTWSDATLNQFLASPSKMVPGTRMLVSTPDPTQPANLIALSCNPKIIRTHSQ